ncbi:conserved hypothetical protein [Vibrio crassostreae]|nr:conserved hypothetical protein [Vibrio crassostreae]
MAKSPLAKNSKTVRHVKNNTNIIPLCHTIPYKVERYREVIEFDVSHLLHLGADSNNPTVNSRVPYLRSFCKKAKQYFENGKSANSTRMYYESLRAFVAFCDAVNVNPFSEAGYLKYVGNDGELRRRISLYEPSKKLWEMNHGSELGIQESSARNTVSCLRTALSWCGLPANSWKNLHRGYGGETNPFKGYSDIEEDILVTRLSALFFTLAPQLIAAKKENVALPNKLSIVIDVGERQEVVPIQTSLSTVNHGRRSKRGTSVKPSAAFNMTMGAAYHLMCFFTSLNDSDVQSIAHPIAIHTDERDKSLQVVKVSSFKARANKEVDAVLTNQSFDVNKRDGIAFIKTLEALSALYSGGEEGSELLFMLNNQGEKSNSFNLTQINKHLTVKLNLLSPTRASSLPWFRELFYSYRNQHIIEPNKVINKLGRIVVSKVTQPCSKQKGTQGATRSAYCILSCYTDLSLKGILLPLSYSEKDADGNIRISLKYRNGENSYFSIPASDKKLIQDIEQFATELADKQGSKKYERLLLKLGHAEQTPKDWNGISPISPVLMHRWSIETNEYFISLQSSRWREMTSNHVYSISGKGGVQSILQNSFRTLEKNYINGDLQLNKIILSQSMQVAEQLRGGVDLEQAKTEVVAKLGIAMLANDKWKKKQEEERAKTNPNGIYCNGRQSIESGKNTQIKTNNAMKLQLPCTEYDMCHKCQSARAIDETNSVYKLISFVDVLKEALNLFPHALEEVHERIHAFELTLEGASKDVYDEAMSLFNKNGRHPRVSMDQAILALHR